MSQSPDTLKALLDACPFAQLTSSRECYPEAPGAGLTLIRIESPLCTATVSPYGAQLLSFAPKGERDWLWVSPNCRFETGSALRGGIPLCLPWFGEHPSDPGKPKHGFARNRPWALTAIASSGDECRLAFELNHPGDDLFAQPFIAELTLQLGEGISLSLNLTNTGSEPLDCSWVLHSYFAIDDLDTVRVEGLEGRQYLDKTLDQQVFTQSGQLHFSGEVDRVYPGVDNPLTLHDTRRLHIDHQGCPTVVTWNPGARLAASIGDIGAGNERGYVCVERGACHSDTWQLAPGEQRRAQKIITQLSKA